MRRLKALLPSLRVATISVFGNEALAFQEADVKAAAEQLVAKDDLGLCLVKTWTEALRPDDQVQEADRKFRLH